MRIKPKRKMRTFTFKNEIGEYGPKCPGPHRWVNEVIDGIENDTLLVFDPKDKDAFKSYFDPDGTQVLQKRATVPISIREWLPVGCQRIRWGDNRDGRRTKTVVAHYDCNARRVLWPPGIAMYRAIGPSAFIGEIVIFEMMLEPDNENKFKCMVAHELVHVFNQMRVVVPAFMDWRRFWKDALDEGLRCEDAALEHQDVGTFLDSYGQKNELVQIQEHWPSQAKTWFKACYKSSKRKRK